MLERDVLGDRKPMWKEVGAMGVVTTSLSDGFGVEISGLDLSRQLGEVEIGELRSLYDRHQLLCFRDQCISGEEHVRAVSYFGPISRESESDSGYSYISNMEVEGRAFVSERKLLMHSDLAYAPKPLQALSLYGAEVAEGCGPTLFASARRAYERLPADLKDRIAKLYAVHVVDHRPGYGDRGENPPLSREILARLPRRDYPRAAHPVAFRASSDEAPVLFVSEDQTIYFVGLSDEEGDSFRASLFAELYRPENMYLHKWRTGDLLIWNNVALQHGRPETPRSARRVLRRVVVSDIPQSYLTEASMVD
jgi:taurine dioxygenase